MRRISRPDYKRKVHQWWLGRVGAAIRPRPRRSARMTHFCSDRVPHRSRRAFVRKPKVGKAISSPPKAGRWVSFREQSRVISCECRRATPSGTSVVMYSGHHAEHNVGLCRGEGRSYNSSSQRKTSRTAAIASLAANSFGRSPKCAIRFRSSNIWDTRL